MILDETFEFTSAHVAASQAQLDAMTLYAAATHAISECVTFGRMLFTSETEESGKTLAMMVTASLCSAPMDTSGTLPALDSALATASNEPEKPGRTPYRDEISDVFGRSGLNGSNNPVAELLRKGYKRGATRQRSVNRVPEEFSIFTPFLMTGLRTAVPRDIRSRCIVILMMPGTPDEYFDVREGEKYAGALQQSLAATVKRHLPEIGAFRGRGIHPKLKNRKLEVWEPLLAVAYVLGGQRWLNRAVAAFCELALDETDVIPLTPRQQVLSDLSSAASRLSAGRPGEPAFISGLSLSDELRRLDRPIYAGRSQASVSCLIRDTMPVASEQRRIDGAAVRGYPLSEILDAWTSVEPPTPDDVEMPEEIDPFDVPVTGDDVPVTASEPVTCGVTGVTGVTGTLSVDVPVHTGILASGGTNDEHSNDQQDS